MNDYKALRAQRINQLDDELAQIAIQRLADQRIDRATYSSDQKWLDAISREVVWLISLYEADQIAQLNRRELAEMVRDGFPPIDANEWVAEQTDNCMADEEGFDEALTNLLSDLRTL